MICDKVTALSLAQAVTAALYHRRSTGIGQHVEVSMLEAGLYFIWPDRMFDESFVGAVDLTGPDMANLYQVQTTKDGHIALVMVQVEEVQGLFRALGRTDLESDPRFQDIPSLLANANDMLDEIRPEFSKWETEELSQRLLAEDVPFGVVLTGTQLLDDPQVLHSGAIKEIDHPDGGRMRLVERTARFSASPSHYRSPAPSIGEHTTDVLRAHGYSEDEVDALRAQAIIQ
jgi:crotonobetainyl-CoA:carnitine CoA-transferase CaiB-like acyl-CoA transferase